MHNDSLKSASRIKAHRLVGGRHRLLANTTWLLYGRVGTFFLQGLYFLLLARVLHANEYGVFAGALALVSAIAPYSAVGSGMLFVRYVGPRPADAPRYWANGLRMTAWFTGSVSVLAFSFGQLLVPTGSRWMLVLLVVSQCFFLQITTLGGMLFLALGKASASASILLVTALIRVEVLAVFWLLFGSVSAIHWSVGVLIASTAAALWVRQRTAMVTRGAVVDLKLLRGRAWEGLGFSFAGTTEAVNNDLDKAMLSHFGLNAQNGVYTLAYRVLDFAASPIHALSAAVMQRQFVLGATGFKPMFRLTAQSLLAVLPLGLLMGTGSLLAGPVLAAVAGRDFSEASLVLRMLWALPVLRGIQQTCGNLVTGAGHQNLRTAAQCAVAVLNVTLNLHWIPTYGWQGAAWATLVTDGALALLNVVLAALIAIPALRREQLVKAVETV